jgi:glycosyltransferase involved in cell wall biosynthesis
VKHIYFSVTNDLTCDQRVHRIINSLQKPGIICHLLGRKLRGKHILSHRDYITYRFTMLFTSGFFFYAFYNIRLSLFLLTRKKIDVLVANDLDTLPANYLVSKIRNVNLVYDSHEYFTESPELFNRIVVRKFWLWLEKVLVPGLKYTYTVSQSISEEYYKKYGVKFKVVRNFSATFENYKTIPLPFTKGNRKVLIYQGSLNIGRGLELIIESVKEMEGVVFLIVGDGDISGKLRHYVKSENLSDKVFFTGKIPFENVHSLTLQSDGGVSLEEDMGLNYRYSLPNKLFDYINAGIPILVSQLPEMARIVNDNQIGIVCMHRDTDHVRQNIRKLLFDTNKREMWKKNLFGAAREFSWKNEEKVLLEIYSPLI